MPPRTLRVETRKLSAQIRQRGYAICGMMKRLFAGLLAREHYGVFSYDQYRTLYVMAWLPRTADACHALRACSTPGDQGPNTNRSTSGINPTAG